MDTKELKKIFRGFTGRFKRRRMRRAHIAIDAHRDWKFVLAAVVFAEAIIVLGSAYLFLEIRKGEIFLAEPPSVVRVNPIDRTLLSEILFHYSELERRHAALKDNPPILADPSR